MDYLKVLGCQLKVVLDSDGKNEFLVNPSYLREQIEFIKEIIKLKNPDVVIFPEMCYLEEMQDYFMDISHDKLIVAGSIYEDEHNTTKVFSNGSLFNVVKCNASGAEPMVRTIQSISTEEFLKHHLLSHTFMVKDKKIVVLNCMEYYQNAYYIARECPDVFGIISICSNSNVDVFLEETRAIHNHNEKIYTFMVNCVSNYMGKDYGKGYSYVYGPIQGHEKEWLLMDGIKFDEHVSSILRLGEDSEYFYGEFINDFSRFGRSDNYLNNPRGVETGMIRKKVLK